MRAKEFKIKIAKEVSRRMKIPYRHRVMSKGCAVYQLKELVARRHENLVWGDGEWEKEF